MLVFDTFKLIIQIQRDLCSIYLNSCYQVSSVKTGISYTVLCETWWTNGLNAQLIKCPGNPMEGGGRGS